jgi:anti-sigma regulatory factor (Ser/Thr protein kinase)
LFLSGESFGEYIIKKFTEEKELANSLYSAIENQNLLFPFLYSSEKMEICGSLVDLILDGITNSFEDFNINFQHLLIQNEKIHSQYRKILNNLSNEIAALKDKSIPPINKIWINFLSESLIKHLFYTVICTQISQYRDPRLPFEKRTEFLRFLNFKDPITQIEKETGCLVFEDGEISLLLLEYNFIKEFTHNNGLLEHVKYAQKQQEHLIHLYEELGLIIKFGTDKFRISDRAKRMARWIQKFLNIKTIDFVHNNFAELKNGKIWKWLWQIGADPLIRSKIDESTSNIIEANSLISKGALVMLFDDLNKSIFHENYCRSVEEITKSTPINFNIHEFIRKNEDGSRGMLCFALTGLPDINRESSSIVGFIGSCNLHNGVDGKTEAEAIVNYYNLRNQIESLKTILTLIGIPGMKFILDTLNRAEEEANVNAFLSHAFKRPATRAKSIIKSIEHFSDTADLKKYLKEELEAPIDEILRLTRLFGFITTSVERHCLAEITTPSKTGNSYTIKSQILTKFIDVIEHIKSKGWPGDRRKVMKWIDEALNRNMTFQEYLLKTKIKTFSEDHQLRFIFKEKDDRPTNLPINERSDEDEAPDTIFWNLIVPELLTNAIKFSDKDDPIVLINIYVEQYHGIKKFCLSVYNNGKLLEKDEYERPGQFKSGQDRRHLGIALNKKAASLLGWQIEVVDTEEIKATKQGGCVLITIPIPG